MLLGMAVGYERSYNGRAAGMRTYGLVCMASTALTIFVGFAPLWYGGASHGTIPDATRVVQGRGHGNRVSLCRRDFQGGPQHHAA